MYLYLNRLFYKVFIILFGRSMNILFKHDIVFNSKNFTISQDREVPIEAFLIISPKRKVRRIDEFSEEELHEFISLLSKTRKLMFDVLHIEDVYFFQNEDSNHNFHFWIFPRHQWMENFWRRIQSVRPIMEHATKYMADKANCQKVKKIAATLKDHFQRTKVV